MWIFKLVLVLFCVNLVAGVYLLASDEIEAPMSLWGFTVFWCSLPVASTRFIPHPFVASVVVVVMWFFYVLGMMVIVRWQSPRGVN